MDGNNMNKQCLHKPHISKLANSINLGFQYRCKGDGFEIFGSSPEDAYLVWKQVVDNYNKMKREWSLHQWNLRDEQLDVGMHRHENIKPFSALRYIETSYSNSSVPLKQLK